MARHGGVTEADDGSGAGGTGRVGLGGIIVAFGTGANGTGLVGFGGIVDDCDCGSGGGGAGLVGRFTTCLESPLACTCNMRGDGAESDTGADDEM